ncbi:ABC transporter permease [Halopelagius longus]|uniref:ABC transporter permease n=1 Tax=Halopelagius longus TaxID=1236180 RepID=A0A1H1GK09_9EURY|nr:ABC transporter permease [Halopelagius longus]RDI69693.1 ABC transporter permease [Halopelagius longus]SDR13544.1 putative ABC transport system permease protein [Halopelagius longus]
MLGSRIRAVAGIAFTQLRRAPERTTLAVLGIALAVLLTTLLASVGFGVIDTGEQKFDAAGRDIWVTGGPVELSAEGGGSLESQFVNAHRLGNQFRKHEQVKTSAPVLFHAVYASSNDTEPKLLTGVGIPNTGSVAIQNGSEFSRADVHYANGSYDGPMTREVIIDPRTAELLNVSVGDTIYVGGSRETVSENRFTVVGISPTFSKFLGTPTVAIHLSELQTVTGTAGTDPATFLTLSLEDGADPKAVSEELAAEYPEYEFRTNREQLQQIIQKNALVLASGFVLVGLAVVVGLALTVNLLAIVVYQQREEFAALQAMGISRGLLVGVVSVQALLICLAGGAAGLLATPVAAGLTNELVIRLVGLESLLRTPPLVYAVGGAIALAIGTGSAAAVGWQLSRIPAYVDLRR